MHIVCRPAIKVLLMACAAAALGSGQGIITTVAGGVGCNPNDEGGLATSTCTPGLRGIALDKQGNFYILTQNFAAVPAWVVRKVTPAGIITTVAGGAATSSGDGGPATKAGFESFGFPSALAIDAAGDLY